MLSIFFSVRSNSFSLVAANDSLAPSSLNRKASMRKTFSVDATSAGGIKQPQRSPNLNPAAGIHTAANVVGLVEIEDVAETRNERHDWHWLRIWFLASILIKGYGYNIWGRGEKALVFVYPARLFVYVVATSSGLISQCW
jgi:hypothetical protein